jgi:hypothetical protein
MTFTYPSLPFAVTWFPSKTKRHVHIARYSPTMHPETCFRPHLSPENCLYRSDDMQRIIALYSLQGPDVRLTLIQASLREYGTRMYRITEGMELSLMWLNQQ